MRQMNSQGFKVDGRAPKVSFGSPDSFLPAYAASEWTVQADVADGLWMYHDEQAYPSEYSLRLEQERAEKEEQEKRLAAERKMKQEESSKGKSCYDVWMISIEERLMLAFFSQRSSGG